MMKRFLFGDDASTPHEFFRMLTAGGATALGFNDAGVIQEGTAADFVLLDVSGPRFIAGNHWPARIVNTATAGDVRDVVVGGEVVVRDGSVQTLDKASVLAEAREAAKLVLDHLNWDVTGAETAAPEVGTINLMRHAPIGRIGSWGLRLGRQYSRDHLG